MAADKAFSPLTRDVLAWCDRLATLSEDATRLTRTFLSAPFREVHAQLGSWMQELGMTVRVDNAGNLRGRRESRLASAPTFLIGSHLDTVPDAGRYDGVLGVVLGVAMVEALAGVELAYALEIIGFSEEEGVRFGKPFIGSRALVGTLDEELLSTPDGNGVTAREALEAYSLNPSELEEALAPQPALGYLEVHIEQGPVLEALGRPLGAVDTIAGQSRLELSFTGQANHAGTTPMPLRRDALTGAAEFVLAAEALARQADGLVATVGRIEVSPGAGNVVPGEVRLSLDVRHARDTQREEAVRLLLAAGERIASGRGLAFGSRPVAQQAAVPMDARLTGLLHAVTPPGTPVLTSGAGHDAMIVAPFIPSAMLFVRSPGGLSHHPDEAVLADDVSAALEVGVALLKRLNEEVSDG